VARPGVVAIVPPNTPHSVRALTDGRAIIVDHPVRWDVGG
jgi:quercetin dioxygenase-like cupin family protein